MADASRPSLVAAFVERAMVLVAPLFSARVEGFVDRMIADEVFGWALDRGRPGRRVLVVASLDGKVIAEALADLPRRDLEEIGKGDGRCGFRVKVPSDLDATARTNLVIEARVGLGRHVLKKAKRFIVPPQAGTPPKAAEPARGPTAGFLERCDGRILKGWAVDPNNPDSTPKVDIFAGELFLGSVAAEINRPRLREVGVPFGARGFEFVLPAIFNGQRDDLRARIAGTRIDLRRSRAYPGDGGVEDEAAVGSQASRAKTFERFSPGLEVSTAEAPREGVAFLICGGDRLATAATLQSIRALAPPPTAIATMERQEGESEQTVRIIEDEGDLHQFLRSAGIVVFLAPGQTAAPELTRCLLDADPLADVLHWRTGGQDLGPDADLALLLGARSSGLAVRRHAMTHGSALKREALLRSGLRGAEVAIARDDLRWAFVDAALCAPPPTVEPGQWDVPMPPRRLSLGVWGDWGADTPPAVRTLLGGCAGFDVELLTPVHGQVPSPEVLADLAPTGVRSFNLRLVDAPRDLGDAGLRHAMGQAASGQVLILSHAQIDVPSEAVVDLAAWAYRPGVGLATLALGTESTQAAPDRPIADAAALLLAVSRAALAQVGGFSPPAEAGDPDDLGFAARLRRAGRRSVRLGRHVAHCPSALVEAWLEGPPGDGSRVGDDAPERAAIDT